MTPAFCLISHDPENGQYGDCLRAAVATLLDKSTGDIPHFNSDGVDGDTANQRLREYLATLDLAPWWSHYDPALPYQELLDLIGAQSPGCHYLLFGTTASGTAHVIVCLDNAMAHDPSWYRSPMVKGGPHGAWSIAVIVKK